ncbi:hypothetical protein N7468_002376 [Penicillium chermesinum]|uniref:Ankyrin repeat protein n=1 Tax=Penicillium chermesinum TaxID=63820 RepID=A0A9W9PKJ2_9EURO|nr:uncharacterized protein N7468_002376 [Penicillium chermesinum]KAJ5247393.1 hypothetical protein N7468_002376 [Penicillium chermesinum]
MPRSRTRSIGSEGHERLEPQFLRAAEQDDPRALAKIIALAHEYGQFSDNFLRVGLMRSAERGNVPATEYLLHAGAKTDVASSRLSPLLRAVERDHYQIVRLLLDAGASPDSTDKEGRTALMTAAWKNHADVLQLLIMRGANIVELLLRTECEVDATDELGRTPLHWACATGNRRLVELLLCRADGKKADIDAAEQRGKTALHIAVIHGRVEIVQLLIAHQAAVNACSDGAWTPLHNACDNGNKAIVQILLREGAHINSQLLNGVTPLHLCAQGGHVEVVALLLERPDLKRRVRDNFGSTPFLRASQFKQKEVIKLLAPSNNVDALPDDVKDACKAFDATVISFGNFKNENKVERTSVFNLLYGKDPQNPHKQAFSTQPDQDRATDFRWIHLPANNMSWVESLITKSFIEEGAHDVEGFKGLEKSFNYQHRGKKVHSNFMRPLCQSTPRLMKAKEEKPTDDYASETGQSTADGSSSRKHKGSIDDGSKKHKNKNNPKQGKSGSNPGTPKSETKSKSPWGFSDRSRSSLPSTTLCKEPPGLVSACNVCMYMPYLHFETIERRQMMEEAIRRAETLSFQPQGIKRTRTRDEMLIEAHLSTSTTSLHVRRTLDQFAYPNIDTASRDKDQVVYRYQTKGPGREEAGSPKIFMVDQLWMWVLGTNLIITSFPMRWDQPKNDPLNVLDGIIEDINSKTRDPVQSVYDLAIIITNRCSGVFDRHRLGDDQYQFLDMFESSIGIATDRETILFNRFNRASAQASKWLKTHRKLNRSSRIYRARSGSSDENSDDDERVHHDGSPLFVDDLLDIGKETDLLSEAKDIRDELNMINTVLEHQRNVLRDLEEVICDIYYGQHRSQHEVKKRFKDQQRMIDMHIKDIERMDKQTARIYDSITDLLDLKQKHANVYEARFARDQAAGTNRQGKIIMVFTIVTIIFLPLSFIASVFTINMKEFSDLDLPYVAKYTFGIGFAISIPLILVALSVDDIGDFFNYSRSWLSGKRKRTNVPDSKDDYQDLEFKKNISVARSRRSGDGYGPGLFPTSTRGTGSSPRPEIYVNGRANALRKSFEVSQSLDYRR